MPKFWATVKPSFNAFDIVPFYANLEQVGHNIMGANKGILLTLLLALLAAAALFHFKSQLGILVLPLFIGLVLFVTLKLYRLMEKDDPAEPNDR